MPSGVYKRTKKNNHSNKVKIKISNSLKGKPSGMLGKNHSSNSKLKMKQNHANFNNENHPGWKGGDVGYYALHTWVYRKKGKANKCEFADETCKGPFQWSNISGRYYRDLNDYQSLCISHHKRYDKKIF